MKKKLYDQIYDFVIEVEEKLCLELKNRKKYFPSYDKLQGNFENNVKKKWKKYAPEVINNKDIRKITEIKNELIIAKLILSDSKTICRQLDYEPKPDQGEKTIDFKASMVDGQTIYFDVKTIHPESKDKEGWKKFERQKKFLPKNSRVHLSETIAYKNDEGKILAEYGLGGEIWHHCTAARSRMLEYTQELEKKINNYKSTDKTLFLMTFCSNGYDWALDELEDFADFYRTGSHNVDDIFSNMEDFYIEDKEIKLQQKISGFCYLECKVTKIIPEKFICNVRGPWQ